MPISFSNSKIVFQIKVEGNVPSKKNARNIFFHKQTGRLMNLPQKNYLDWHSNSSIWLKTAPNLKKITEPISFILIKISANSRRKYDLTNKAESVMDLLVDNQIIEDDNSDVIPCVVLVKDPVSKTGYFDVSIYID